jgi:hypothetical protein
MRMEQLRPGSRADTVDMGLPVLSGLVSRELRNMGSDIILNTADACT